MGYTTDFTGHFSCTPPLRPEHKTYLKQFAETRRMKRDPEKAFALPDPIREAANLPLGTDAGNFVGGQGMAGQDRDVSILEYNAPPCTQPGLWCQWVPNEEGTAIEWDGSEKFYNYVEWLQYLVDQYLTPWGYVLNGEVSWQGEDREDIGVIEVVGNWVKTRHGEIVYPDDLAEEFERSSFTPRQIDLIKYAIKFASLNIDEEMVDELSVRWEVLEEEWKELLTKFAN